MSCLTIRIHTDSDCFDPPNLESSIISILKDLIQEYETNGITTFLDLRDLNCNITGYSDYIDTEKTPIRELIIQ